MKVAAVIVLAAVALLAASCGGKKNATSGGSDTTTTTAATTSTAGATDTTAAATTTTAVKLEKLTGNPIAGKKVWVASKCGGCHSLKAAGATGTIGMDFDYLKPSQSTVAGAVSAGGDIMPAYPSLTAKQVNDLAAFVYKSTH